MTSVQTQQAAQNKTNVIASLEDTVRVMTAGADRTNPVHLAAIEKIERAADFIRNSTDDQFWIDCRYDNAQAIIRKIAK